jgi:hypothetical protein
MLDRKAAQSLIRQGRRKEASRKGRFLSLTETPFDMGTVAINNPSPNELVLPESGDIGVSFSVPVSLGQLIVSSNSGRTLGTPNLVADQVWRIGFFERAITMVAQSAVAGTVTIHFLDGHRKPFSIATGVFT